MKALLVLILLINISACSFFQKPTEVTVLPPPIEKPTIVHPRLPSPVNLVPPTFSILTKDNALSYFETSGETVVFSVSAEGYEALAGNMQELRRYILESQSVIEFYKRYIDEKENGNDTNE
jgi:hypothetical protein